jgi:hypothetical protein
MNDVNFTIVKPRISNADFVSAVVERFPAIAADILDEEEDYTHMQVACLTRYANTCIENDDLVKLEQILRFADEIIPNADSSLDNALHVSFIEMLYLDGDAPVRQEARKLLSPWQLDFYIAIQEWYNSKENAELLKRLPLTPNLPSA